MRMRAHGCVGTLLCLFIASGMFLGWDLTTSHAERTLAHMPMPADGWLIKEHQTENMLAAARKTHRAQPLW
jgi:hypothetical protein